MKKKINFFLILFLPVQILIYYFVSQFPERVERFYSNGIFKKIAFFLSYLTDFIPFSLGEAIIYLLFIYLVFKAVQFTKRGIKEKLPFKRILINATIGILSFTSALYFLIMVLWGINYFRLPFQEITGYKKEKPSIEELKSLCTLLIPKCNELRKLVKENKEGVMVMDGGHQQALEAAKNGYITLSSDLPVLKGSYGAPKRFFIPQIWSFFGTGGIYIPFTAEPNVNMDQPDPFLPSVICHELAHKVGFAKEDEANFIAFLTCRSHPNIEFRYSGYLMALNYSLRTLRAADEKAYEELRPLVSEDVDRDFKAQRQYWQKYSGVLMNFTTEFYNLFLKANQQEEGINSYGEMVILLIGELRKEKEI